MVNLPIEVSIPQVDGPDLILYKVVDLQNFIAEVVAFQGPSVTENFYVPVGDTDADAVLEQGEVEATVAQYMTGSPVVTPESVVNPEVFSSEQPQPQVVEPQTGVLPDTGGLSAAGLGMLGLISGSIIVIMALRSRR